MCASHSVLRIMSDISSHPSPRWVDLVADAWSEIIDRIDDLDAQNVSTTSKSMYECCR
jgi:hypothetical protein